MRPGSIDSLRRFVRECRAPLIFCFAIKLAIYLVSGDRYGFISDELYFVQASERLALGYVDFPPMIAWATAGVRATLGDSLFALRFAPFVCGVLVSWIGVAIAYTLGGTRVAVWMTAIIVPTAPIFVSFHAILTMNAFDQLWWGMSLLAFTLYLRSSDPRLLLGLGVTVGIGLLTKVYILVLAVCMLVVLLWSRPTVWRDRALYLGGALALVIGAPFLYWQLANEFPFWDFLSAYRAVQHESPLMDGFVISQVTAMNPAHFIFWLPGFYELLWGGERRWRPLGWLALLVFVLSYVLGVRFYFFAPMYLILVAGGAIFWERLLRPRRRGVTAGVLGFIAFNSLVTLPTGAPILPALWWRDATMILSERMSWGYERRGALSKLFPHFAEMHGWRELSDETVAHYRAHVEQHEELKIVASHFGQASAINHYRQGDEIPWACSGHMQYYYWCRDEQLTAAIAVGYTPEELSPLFSTLEVLGENDCELCTQRDDGSPFILVRDPKLPREEIWRALKRLYIF